MRLRTICCSMRTTWLVHQTCPLMSTDSMPVELYRPKFQGRRCDPANMEWRARMWIFPNFLMCLEVQCSRFASVKKRLMRCSLLVFLSAVCLCWSFTLLQSHPTPVIGLVCWFKRQFLYPEKQPGRWCYQGIWRYRRLQVGCQLWWLLVQEMGIVSAGWQNTSVLSKLIFSRNNFEARENVYLLNR